MCAGCRLDEAAHAFEDATREEAEEEEGARMRDVSMMHLSLLENSPKILCEILSEDFDDIEEDIQVDPVMATAASRSSRVGWIAISVCAISALGWVISQLPSVGEDFGRW